MHRRGVTVSLNDHPHDGIRPHEEMYAAFMADMGADPAHPLLFDLGDRKYMETFFKHAHHASEDMGADFWWLDWQQNYLYPEVRGYRSTSLQWINELYYRQTERKGLRGAGYSRWAGWGDHRHPIQFSGDAQANWEMLAFEVKLTAASGNAGCYYWAHDIGGFRGDPNPELTVRWTQFGALSAALRVHSTKDARLDRRPWISGERETAAMRRMYHMRSELMPYIYSSVWQTHSTMVSLNRPMYIDYGSDERAYENEQEFLFGDILLAATIILPAPLLKWFGLYGLIPELLIWGAAMYFALRLERIKKANNVQSYREILAFSEGRKLDEIEQKVEAGKRPYQKLLLVLLTAGITLLVGMVLSWLLL